MSDTVLRVSDLRIQIGSSRVVDGIGFSVEARQTFALLGESGSGKSMTALAIMRLLPDAARYRSGSIALSGRELLSLPESAMRSVRGGSVGMIFQEPMTSLNPVLTLGEQIAEALKRHRGLRGRALHAEAVVSLQAVGIAEPERRLLDYPFQISGGMKQRVMIAMSLAGNPALLIADEPTTALDVTVQAQVLELLRQVQRERGMGMLLITHDLAVAATMADQVGVMYAGELVEIAPRAAFFQQPRHPYSQRLFAALPDGRPGALQAIPGVVPALDRVFSGCRFVERCDRALDVCHTVTPDWVQLGAGHVARCHALSVQQHGFRSPDRSQIADTGKAGEMLLAVRDVRVHFPVRARGMFGRSLSLKAVDGVDLVIHQGETLALVGESGCGKTTLGKVIVGLQPVTSGLVEWHGNGISQRAAVQMVFQDPFASLNPRMRIDALLEEGMRALGVGANTRDRQVMLSQLLTQVGLPADALGRYPHEFSGGQRQRIAIARALAVRPKLMVCDEPTSALDVSVQAQIVNLLRDIQAEFGLSLLFITHNLSVARHVAQRIAVMYLGRIVESGSGADIVDQPLHPYTRALIAAMPKLSGVAPLSMRGETASAIHPPSGCHFHPRCAYAEPICREQYPAATVLAGGREVRCHFPLLQKEDLAGV